MKTSMLISCLAAMSAIVCCRKSESSVPHCNFTDSYVETSSRSAQISFTVDIPDAADILNVGLLVSLTENPSQDVDAVSKTVKKHSGATYTFDIAALEPATLYRFQPFVLTWEDVAEYGEVSSFTTLEAKMLNGHEFVNLGLKSGTKWAVFNMDIDGKTGRYVWDDPDRYIREQWGDRWRMPTKADWEELMESCFWSWDVQKGRQGMLVRGESGNTIFLPADGYVAQSHLMQENEYGAYWTSDAVDSTPGCFWSLFFGMDFVYWYTFPQSYCASIRPVNNSSFYDYD